MLIRNNIALAAYEEKIASKLDILMSRIAEKQGMPMDMTLYTAFFGFDVMGQVGKPISTCIFRLDMSYSSDQVSPRTSTCWIRATSTQPYKPCMTTWLPSVYFQQCPGLCPCSVKFQVPLEATQDSQIGAHESSKLNVL